MIPSLKPFPLPVCPPRPAHARRPTRGLAAQVLVLAAISWAPHAAAVDLGPDAACPDSAARVVAAVDADRVDACAGAALAIRFFARLGLEATEPPSIEVTAQIPAEAGETAAGCFIEQRQRIYMLPYARFRQQKTWFGVPIDRRMYRSLAAHEAAHALAACHFGIPNPTIQAKEYIAYVAMFDTMDASLRERALAGIPGSGFASEDRITPLLYMFDPMRFGAEAYRHFLKPAVGVAFLNQVLAGKALVD
jgi:hypothetical protein